MHESELGTPLYRRSEAVAVNEDHRRAITVAQCSVGVVRGSSIITEVQRVRFGVELAGVWVLRASSRNSDGAGPSATESAFRACRPRWLCYGRALACMRPRGEPGSDGRRGTAFCRGVPPVGRHGRSRRRRRRRRGRASVLPTPGRLHARVCSFGQEEEAARNVPRALWPRD